MHDQAIGNMIKLCRRKKQITLQVLSEQTGLSVSYLSTLERGLSSPTIANLNLICEALGITMADLILKLDEKSPSYIKTTGKSSSLIPATVMNPQQKESTK